MNSKDVIRLLFFVISYAVFVSCASKKDDGHEHEDQAHDDESVWEEMDKFHMIMAETFHPYKDSANLEPAKARATELLAAANAWIDAPLPERVDEQEVKSKLQQLKSDAAAFTESVQSADDNAIAEQLRKLHDTFHAIQDEWYKHE